MKKRVFAALLILLLLFAACAGAEKKELGEKKLGEEFKFTVKSQTEDAIVMTIRSKYDREAFEFVSGRSKYGHWGKNGASLINLLEPLNGEIGTLTFRVLEDAIPGEYSFIFSVTGAYTLEEEKARVKIPEYTVVVLDTLVADPERIAGFLAGCYRELLGREIDESGLNYWSEVLIARTANASDVVGLLVGSDEYKGLGLSAADTVEGLYESMLGRASDESGKAAWVSVLEDGCSPQRVVSGFCDSEEFKTICLDCGIRPGHPTITENRDANVSLTAFVTRCYRIGLQRDPDVDGLNSWCGSLLDGSMTPSQVVGAFILSDEMDSKLLSNEETVANLYRLYMNREPDTQGQAFWVCLMDGGVPLSEISASFAASDEFRELAESYGLQ